MDLQAKFASLLKQSKESKDGFAKQYYSTSVPNSGKQDKKGEKKDHAAVANARNQLFGEQQRAAQAKDKAR